MPARSLLLCPLVALVLTGCRAPAPVYMVREEPELVCVDEPPPAPQLEVPPAPPDESYVWQAGYWRWDDGGYDWVDGSWVEPYEGYTYVEPYYGFVGGSWVYRPPYWAPGGRRHRHHRPRHGPKVVAQGPRENHPPAATGPQVHRAPPAEPKVHRAPPVEETKPHRAPPAPELLDPDRPTGAEPIEAAHASGDLDMMREPIPPRRPRVIRIVPEPVVAANDAWADDDVVEVDLSPDVTRRPEYRGMRSGRPVFGDDPDVRRPPRYEGPRTIVVGDGEPGHRRGGRIIVSQPGDVDAAPAPKVVRRERPFLEPDPPIRRAPWPERAPMRGWRGPRPEGPRPAERSPRIAHRVAMSPSPGPSPRMVGPAPVRRAPVRAAAPVHHVVQRSAPVRVSAPRVSVPRVSAPSRGPAVSRRGR